MEDTIIVRTSMMPQVTNNSRELAVHSKQPTHEPSRSENQRHAEKLEETVHLSMGDIQKLHEMANQIDELRSHASFSSCWRQEAEADYMATRKRLLDSESLCSTAFLAANEAGQLSTSLGSRLAWMEIQLTSKEHQLGDHSLQLDNLENSGKIQDSKLTNLLDRLTALENNHLLVELATLRQRVSELEEKHSKEKLKRKNLEQHIKEIENCNNLKIEELHRSIVANQDSSKVVQSTLFQLQKDILDIKNNDREPQLAASSSQDNVVNCDAASHISGTQYFAQNENLNNHMPNTACSQIDGENSSMLMKFDGLEASIHRFPRRYPRRQPLAENTTPGGGTNHKYQNAAVQRKEEFNPPLGPKKWLEGMSRGQRKQVTNVPGDQVRRGLRKRTPNTMPNNRLYQLETEISKLKTAIKNQERKQVSILRKDKPTPSPNNSRRNQEQDSGWTVQKARERRRTSLTTRHTTFGVPWSKKCKGTYKLMIRAADDGSLTDIEPLYMSVIEDKKNKVLLGQIATVGNLRFEYQDRDLLNHNHRGGVLFSVENPQEAARFENLGVYIFGKKHRVISFVKAQANDMCQHCSAWGHLERNCRVGGSGRCAICAKDHRTEHHGHNSSQEKKGKDRLCCPNCGGNHTADDDNCLQKKEAFRRHQDRNPRLESKGKRFTKKTMKRGATPNCGHGRRHG